jgi:hypothetical protein
MRHLSDLSAWLASRRPRPPEELAVRLPAAVGSEAGGEEGGAELVRRLTRAGRVERDRALRRPGRVRESAFHLLTADAVFTYACEAALEDEDPEAALRLVLEVGAGP